MTRTVEDAKIQTRTSRAKLAVGTIHWREIARGFHVGYRKTRGGNSSWIVRWRPSKDETSAKVSGYAYKQVTLEGRTEDTKPDGITYEQAVDMARDLVGKEMAGRAPDGKPITVRKACADYVAWLKVHRKTSKDAEQRLALHVLPKIGDKLVVNLTTADIERVHHDMVHGPKESEVERASKNTANRVLSSLKAALNWVYARPDEYKIPSRGAWDRRVKAFEKVNVAREVFLDEPQVQRLINVTSGAFRHFVTAAYLTGCRPPHEMADLKVRDFNAKLGVLHVPHSKTGPRDVVLTNEAVTFFTERAAGKEPDDLLLPKDDGTRWGKAHHVRDMREAVAKAKLPKGTTAYTLRHTYASHALLTGMPTQLLAENMGTSLLMIEHHYGKFSAASRRQLIEAHGPKLGLKPGNVTPLQPRRSRSKPTKAA